MSNVPPRAVVIGAPLACCALVTHFYLSISFEHEAQIFLYGLYIIFVYVVWPLSQLHAQLWKHHLQLATFLTLLVLFTLGSAQIVFLISEMLEPPEEVKALVAYSQFIIYVFANYVTGAFFMYRLHVIWAYKKSIFLSPILLGYLVGHTYLVGFVSTHVFSSDTGKAAELLNSIFRAVLLYTSVTSTAMALSIAGRIWWISRRLRAVLGWEFAGTQVTATAMFLESGFAYAAAIAICTISLSAREQFFPNMFSDRAIFSALTQIAGIASTATLVQKAHGTDVSIEEVESVVSGWTLSDLHFERSMNENSARRSASPDVTLIYGCDGQIGDLEAGKAQGS